MLDLSIIVPVYNVEEYIRPCFESIFRQGLNDSNYELIIVNDGSTDRSMEMIADIISQHDNIKVINQTNQSLSVARNNGIAAAKGEYILMLDSDDLLIENSLKPLLEKALETKADIIVAKYLILNNEEIDQLPHNKIIQPIIATQETTGIELLKELEACYVWNKLYRCDFILQNKIFFTPRIRFQDIPFTHECFLKAENCIKVNLFLIVYRRGHMSDSFPNSFNKEKALDFCTAIAATWQLTQTKDTMPDVKNAIRNNLLASYYDLLYRLIYFTDNSFNYVEIFRYLYKLAPNLWFSNSFVQYLGSLLSRIAPHIYLRVLVIHWKKKTHLRFDKKLWKP